MASPGSGVDGVSSEPDVAVGDDTNAGAWIAEEPHSGIGRHALRPGDIVKTCG